MTAIGSRYRDKDPRTNGRVVEVVDVTNPRGRSLLFYTVRNVATGRETVVSERTLARLFEPLDA